MPESSASRQNRETLKVFKDSGGFEPFFPPDDDIEGHKRELMTLLESNER